MAQAQRQNRVSASVGLSTRLLKLLRNFDANATRHLRLLKCPLLVVNAPSSDTDGLLLCRHTPFLNQLAWLRAKYSTCRELALTVQSKHTALCCIDPRACHSRRFRLSLLRRTRAQPSDDGHIRIPAPGCSGSVRGGRICRRARAMSVSRRLRARASTWRARPGSCARRAASSAGSAAMA